MKRGNNIDLSQIENLKHLSNIPEADEGYSHTTSEEARSNGIDMEVDTEGEEEAIENIKRGVDSVGTFDSDKSDKNSDGEVMQGLDAVRHAYLCDKKNHFLKCMMLSLAAKRSKKDVKKTDKLMQFQTQFFERRKIKPTIDDIICLGNTIKKFSNRMNMLYDWTQKKKVAYFLKWKLYSFGYQHELMRQVNLYFEKGFELSYRKAKKCN